MRNPVFVLILFSVLAVCTGCWIVLVMLEAAPPRLLGLAGCALMTLALGARLLSLLRGKPLDGVKGD